MLARLEIQEGAGFCQDELHTYQAGHEEAPVVEVAQALRQAELWPSPGRSDGSGWLRGGITSAAGCLRLACRRGLKTCESQAMGFRSTTSLPIMWAESTSLLLAWWQSLKHH